MWDILKRSPQQKGSKAARGLLGVLFYVSGVSTSQNSGSLTMFVLKGSERGGKRREKRGR